MTHIEPKWVLIESLDGNPVFRWKSKIVIQMFPSRFIAITETKEKKMTTGVTAAFLIAGAGH